MVVDDLGVVRCGRHVGQDRGIELSSVQLVHSKLGKTKLMRRPQSGSAYLHIDLFDR